MIAATAHPGSVVFGALVCAVGAALLVRLWQIPKDAPRPNYGARFLAMVALFAFVGVFGVWNFLFGLTDKPSSQQYLPRITAAPDPGDGCNPNYSGCLATSGDYDCAGGGGDGPLYVGAVQVIGTDVFALDADGDGVGCE